MMESPYDKIFNKEEYIQHEWTAERRSDFINGKLMLKPIEKDIHNAITLALYYIFHQTGKKAFQVYGIDIKVSVPNENKYYYPDVFVTKEQRTESNQYIKYEPEVIVEVVSPSSQIMDYVYRYIDYTKIASLKYYLIVEPETILVTVYEKTDTGWETKKYTRVDEEVILANSGISFLVNEVYS